MSELPAVRLRALTAADNPVLRLWGGTPERFLGVAELLEAAVVPGTVTWLAEDPQGHVVAVFQAAPEEDGERSVALLVHPGRRGAGYGTACVLAAMGQPWLQGAVLTATIDRENVASLRCFARAGFLLDTEASSRSYAGLAYRPPALEILSSTRERGASWRPDRQRHGWSARR
jgi:GNAT superfamily N-acetyltransferase